MRSSSIRHAFLLHETPYGRFECVGGLYVDLRCKKICFLSRKVKNYLKEERVLVFRNGNFEDGKAKKPALMGTTDKATFMQMSDVFFLIFHLNVKEILDVA